MSADADRENKVRGWIKGRGIWTVSRSALLIAIGVCVVGVVFSYGLRTPLVMGPLLGPKLEAQALAQGVELEIGAISGVGLTGVRFHHVQVGVEGGGGRIEVSVPQVDAYPDVWASLSARRPVIQEVQVAPVDVAAMHGQRDGRSVAQQQRNGEVTPTVSDDALSWLSDELKVVVESLAVRAAGVGELAQFEALYAVLDVPAQDVVEFDTRGEMAGIDIDLTWSEDAIFADIGVAKINKILEPIGVTVELEGVSLHRDRLSAFAGSRQLEDLSLHLHELTVSREKQRSLSAFAGDSTVRGTPAQIEWSTPVLGLQEAGRDYELSDVLLTYRPDASGIALDTTIVDEQGGRVEISSQWHLPTSLVSVDAWITDFAWDGSMPWPFAEKPPVVQGRVDGTFHGDVDLLHRLVTMDAVLRFQDLELELPLLTQESMHIEALELALPLTLDARGKTLSIVDGSATIGDLNPFELDARIVDAGGNSHIFDVVASADNIDASRLFQSLPAEMTGVAAESEMDGFFGVEIVLAGHSAYPESLVLNVDLGGDVDVIKDASWLENGKVFDQGRVILVDGSDGSQSAEVHAQWQPLGELPDYIPAAVLAAEDTAFFEHDGLDWQGLRMAMVENIEERALVRGGSTITQQVAKNIFLTHDRTLFRKLQESFLAWRVEETLSKEEILELYLNIVEWGPDIRGLAAAAEYYFDTSAEDLEPLEIVALASILPSPHRFGGALKAGYLPSSREDKMRRVLENMRFLEQLSWEQYYAAIEQLDQQRLGRLALESCADDESASESAMECDEIEVKAREGQTVGYEMWDGEELSGGVGWMPLTH